MQCFEPAGCLKLDDQVQPQEMVLNSDDSQETLANILNTEEAMAWAPQLPADDSATVSFELWINSAGPADITFISLTVKNAVNYRLVVDGYGPTVS